MQTLLIALMLPALAIPVVYGVGKKSEVPQYHDQKGIVKREGRNPEPFFPFIANPWPLSELQSRVSEKGSKEKHLKYHPDYHTKGA